MANTTEAARLSALTPSIFSSHFSDGSQDLPDTVESAVQVINENGAQFESWDLLEDQPPLSPRKVSLEQPPAASSLPQTTEDFSPLAHSDEIVQEFQPEVQPPLITEEENINLRVQEAVQAALFGMDLQLKEGIAEAQRQAVQTTQLALVLLQQETQGMIAAAHQQIQAAENARGIAEQQARQAELARMNMHDQMRKVDTARIAAENRLALQNHLNTLISRLAEIQIEIATKEAWPLETTGFSLAASSGVFWGGVFGGIPGALIGGFASGVTGGKVLSDETLKGLVSQKIQVERDIQAVNQQLSQFTV